MKLVIENFGFQGLSSTFASLQAWCEGKEEWRGEEREELKLPTKSPGKKCNFRLGSRQNRVRRTDGADLDNLGSKSSKELLRHSYI